MQIQSEQSRSQTSVRRSRRLPILAVAAATRPDSDADRLFALHGLPEPPRYGPRDVDAFPPENLDTGHVVDGLSAGSALTLV